ncbi:MAG TPA: DegT/DnrJ/EryC1/StrS family aminotransferase [Terriglobales bacterium]|nr:DegT/DnrJ/EryC1/StrS family aminotransferase [Terriglobales bacterium]
MDQHCLGNRVPFIDLSAHHEPIRDEVNKAISEVIDHGAFAGGPFVEKFEQEFAAYCGSKFAIGVGSGTEALWLALLAAGVGPGDEVITVPNTFMATAEAITYCGARPVFVDVDECTYTLDAEKLEAALTPSTKAIIPVHLFGQPADLDPIFEFAAAHDLIVIEDAAQAHGARYKGKRAGTLARAGCFSFYPGKNLGAFGEAGAIVTNDDEVNERIRCLRDHGQVRKYHHNEIGWNCRMDGVQAAVLRVKLKYLDKCNASRRRHAAVYNQAFAQVDDIVTPKAANYAEHVYHIYAVRVQEREHALWLLGKKGIQFGIHYPVPIHRQKAYAFLGYDIGSFPVAETLAHQLISLPMFPELARSQIDTVVYALKEATLAAALA